MAYIANRPVRFDRDYAIGETIPDNVIDPKMTTKLIGMGRIIHIPDKGEPEDTATDGAESPVDGDNGEGGTDTSEDTENAPDGKSDGAEGAESGEPSEETDGQEEFKCEECGKTFASANALAAHSRVHKK